MARKQLSDAIADFDRAIAIEPELAAAYENKAFTLLIGGQFANGWHAMEWRWKRNEARSRGLSTSKPLFKPNTTKKRLLVWAEQGVGDEIMFGSLLPEARRLCTKLLVKVDARLIPLFARSFENMEFFHRTAHVSEDAYDEHIPMGSLCQYLRPNEQSFKNASKVQLVADQARSSAIRETLGVRSGQKLCGISWRSKAEKSGADRSVSLASLAAALSLPHHRLVNLQYGDTKDEITQVGRQLGIDVLSCEDVDNFKDIDGLASLIQACDVVVSVSNVTVHLAGALGKDVRVLVPHMSNWRWMLDRSDSPWYASVRLYRQAAFDDWTGVFGQVRADLLG